MASMVPTLLIEGSDHLAADEAAVSDWVARQPQAGRVVVAGASASLFDPPWPAVVAAWIQAVGRGAGARS